MHSFSRQLAISSSSRPQSQTLPEQSYALGVANGTDALIMRFEGSRYPVRVTK